MIKKEMSIKDIAELLLPIFNKYNINNVWVVGEFATRNFTKDPILVLIYDEEKSLIEENVDYLFDLLEDISRYGSNIACTSTKFLNSNEIKQAFSNRIKLEA